LNNQFSPGQIIVPDNVLYVTSPDTTQFLGRAVDDGVGVYVGVGVGEEG
jgi:hypothetical protein